MKRVISLFLVLIAVLCLPFGAAAADNAAPEKVSLEAVFEEAAQEARTASDPKAAAPELEEYTAPDGRIVRYTGYPTAYSGKTARPYVSESEDYDDGYGRIYKISSRWLTQEDGTEEVWGYLFSRLKYQTRPAMLGGRKLPQRRIGSFSYELEPAEGYEFTSMDIYYYSHSMVVKVEAVDRHITVDALKLTNFPTSSLGWVFCDLPSGIDATAVQYMPTLNGVKYRALSHHIV